jgi:tetratricopeptide (TPR) repeat protein
MKPARPRLSSEVLKRGYSDEEVANIYELARFSLENGDYRRAERIADGLVAVAPEFAPAWLCLSFVHLNNKSFDQAISCAQQAQKLDSDSAAALLYLVAGLLGSGDFNSAGTHLGELGERIESGSIDDPATIRFYRAQLARYQSRG